MTPQGDWSKQADQIQNVLDGINKKLKDPLFTRGSQSNWSDIPGWTSTGSILLDAVMTSYDANRKPIGSGWAWGRWYEIYGPEASGKSTIVEHAFAETQKAGGTAALLDSESKLYKPRATQIGVDLDRLVLMDAPYIEAGIEGFNLLMEAVQNNKALQQRGALMAWDTLASCRTFNEYKYANKGTLDDKDEDVKKWAGGMAEKARTIRGMFRDLTNKLPGYRACFILVNQLSSTMAGGKYEKQNDTTGGWGPRFHSSARLDVSKFGVYVDPYNKERLAGARVRVKFEKSSLFKPYAQVELPMDFETGVDNNLSLVEFHQSFTKLVVNKAGRYYCESFFGSEATGKYLPEFLTIVKQDELFRDFLLQKLRENVDCFWRKAAGYADKDKDK